MWVGLNNIMLNKRNQTHTICFLLYEALEQENQAVVIEIRQMAAWGRSGELTERVMRELSGMVEMFYIMW